MLGRKPVCFGVMLNMRILYLLFCVFVPTLSRKEYPDLDIIPKEERKLFFELVKRLQKNNDDGFMYSDQHSRKLQTAAQQCEMTTNSSAIIKRSSSEKNGAKFLTLAKDVESNAACSKLCCENTSCDMAVYENKDGHYCYLFSCHDLCEFGYHESYMSNWIKHAHEDSHVAPEGSEQEVDLVGLGDEVEDTAAEESPPEESNILLTSSSAQSIAPQMTTTTLTTTGSLNLRAHSVGLNGTCEDDVHCEDPNSVCQERRCYCRESFYEKNHICREVCTPSSFECLELGTHGRGPQCVAGTQVCDGTTNCADGSDEFNCPDTGIPPFRPQEGPSQSKLLQQSFEHQLPVQQKEHQYATQQEPALQPHGQSTFVDDRRSKNKGSNPGSAELPSKPLPSTADIDLPEKYEEGEHSQVDISQQMNGYDNTLLNRRPSHLYPGYPVNSAQKPVLQAYAQNNPIFVRGDVSLHETSGSDGQPQQGFASLQGVEQSPGRKHDTTNKVQTHGTPAEQSLHLSALQNRQPDFPTRPQEGYLPIEHGTDQTLSEEEQQVGRASKQKQVPAASSLTAHTEHTGSSNPQQPLKMPLQGKGQATVDTDHPAPGPAVYSHDGDKFKPHPSLTGEASGPVKNVPLPSQHQVIQPEVEQKQKQHQHAVDDSYSPVQQHPHSHQAQQVLLSKDGAVYSSPSRPLSGSSSSGSSVMPKAKHFGEKSQDRKADSLQDLDSEKAYVVPGHSGTQGVPGKLHHPSQSVGVPEKPHSQSTYNLHGGEAHSPLELEGQKDYLQASGLSDLDRQGAPQFLDSDPYIQQPMYGQQYPSHRYQAPYLQQSSGHGSRYQSYPDQTYPVTQNQRLYQQQGYLGLQDLGYPAAQYDFGDFEPSYSETDAFPSGPDIPVYRQDYKLGYDTPYKTEPAHGLPSKLSKQGSVSSSGGQEEKDDFSKSKEHAEPEKTADVDDSSFNSSPSSATQSTITSSRTNFPATTVSTKSKPVEEDKQDKGSVPGKETKVSQGAKSGAAAVKANGADTSVFVTKEEMSISGITADKQGPIIALSLGLAFTLILLFFVACRLRTVRHRLRKGRPLHSNEADYLINGMYL